MIVAEGFGEFLRLGLGLLLSPACQSRSQLPGSQLLGWLLGPTVKSRAALATNRHVVT